MFTVVVSISLVVLFAALALSGRLAGVPPIALVAALAGYAGVSKV